MRTRPVPGFSDPTPILAISAVLSVQLLGEDAGLQAAMIFCSEIIVLLSLWSVPAAGASAKRLIVALGNARRPPIILTVAIALGLGTTGFTLAVTVNCGGPWRFVLARFDSCPSRRARSFVGRHSQPFCEAGSASCAGRPLPLACFGAPAGLVGHSGSNGIIATCGKCLCSGPKRKKMCHTCSARRDVWSPCFCNNGAPGNPVSGKGPDPLDQRACGDHIP